MRNNAQAEADNGTTAANNGTNTANNGTNGKNKRSIREIGDKDTDTKIRPGMDEEERTRVLESKQIRAAEYNPENKVTAAEIRRLEGMYVSRAGAIFKRLAEKCGVFRTYRNEDVGIEFDYTRRGLNESKNKQIERGGTAEDFGKMLTVLPQIIDGAVEIKADTDRYAGTRRADPQLKEMHVLLGAFRDGADIIPVQLEIKEYLPGTRQANKLYVSVTLTTKEAGITPRRADSSEMNPHILGTPASNIKISDVLKNVNDPNGKLVKYFPDSMLNEEQYAAKNTALENDRSRVEKLRGETDRSSMRDNTTDDTAAERKGKQESYANLRAENAKLREQLDYWKGQTKLTKEKTVRKTDADAYAKRLTEQLHNPKAREQVADEIKRMGDYIVQTPGSELSYTEAKDWALAIADYVLQDSQTVIDDSQADKVQSGISQYLGNEVVPKMSGANRALVNPLVKMHVKIVLTESEKRRKQRKSARGETTQTIDIKGKVRSFNDFGLSLI